jgi:hypothetical protein
MTTLLNVIKGLRHGEERPREAGRVSNHAQRWMLRTCPASELFRPYIRYVRNLPGYQH